MAKIAARSQIDLVFQFTINEEEARALEDLAGYGTDAFIRVFNKELGKAYMEKHEEGLRSFLDSVQKILPKALGAIDSARKIFSENLGEVG